MKKTIKFFDISQTILFILLFLVGCVSLFEYVNKNMFGGNEYSFSLILGRSITVILLLAFVLGIVYLVIGIVVFVFRAHKNPSDKDFAKKIMLRGIGSMIISFIFFFFLSFALSFFGPTLSGSLPRIPYNTGEKFPMQDLQVITTATGSDSAHLKYYQKANDAPFSSRSAESPGNCDIIIKNTNSKLMAGDITLYSSKTNKLYHISPDYVSSNGLTFAWIITDYTSDDCSEFRLQSASVYK